MANEILKDEILSEEELDQVAGGTVVQTASDSQFLRDVGINDEYTGWGNNFTERQFEGVSKVVIDGWAKIGITCTPSKDGENTYSMNGAAITRKEAYEEAMKVMDKHLALSRYDFKTV